ncbi:MAG TPA: hypothetical protein VHR41_13900 [Gemmatimonadales bacterium]|jgi:hypothetical protein|nr:hypothetical protein [Gemmatimonadales bacterium]
MPRLIRLATFTLLAAAIGCGERGTPTQPVDGVAVGATHAATPGRSADERAIRERLAHRLARAMADAGFRAYLKSELDRSTVREHKVQFQRFLAGGNRRALRQVARLNGEAEAGVETDARQAISLELYLPVPAHRARWTGGENILVATEREDREAPVAYDIRGRRRILRADQPPDMPVLALVPVETDFDHPAAAPFICCSTGGTTAPPGLYMTASHFVQDFEGWLKGSPEYEIHILGQSGATDSLTSYQCAGEHAGGYYAFDQNSLEWTGSVLLFTQTQLNSYKSQHPGQNFRIVAFEDDDGACSIRLDGERFKTFQNTLQNSYPNLTGGKDTLTGGLTKLIKRANALQKILRAAYSFITSQDDLIGNAIEDVVVGEYHSGFNWIVRGENNVTNGWLKLQMR